MTQEEKAKAYDEAINKAESLYKTAEPMSGCNILLEIVFPELARIENKRIRKDLIQWINEFPDTIWRGHYKKDVINWLEKQGEQKPKRMVSAEAKEAMYSKPTDLEVFINELSKQFPDVSFAKLSRIAVRVAKWAKPTDEEMKELLRTEYRKGRADTIAEMKKPSTIDIDKMVSDYANNKERGNEEFGKPVPCMVRAYRQGLNDAIGKILPKPTWSEEDEMIALSIEQVMNCASLLNIVPEKIDKIRTWLKSLKDKYTWKPSEGQLDALKRTQTGVIQFSVLQNLYNDLKKL